MNPSGKCIDCQNPWGSLTSCTDDENMETDTETCILPEQEEKVLEIQVSGKSDQT